VTGYYTEDLSIAERLIGLALVDAETGGASPQAGYSLPLMTWRQTIRYRDSFP